MSDALEGYTVTLSGEEFVVLDCDRCGAQVIEGHLLALAVLVRAAGEHSGGCLG